MPRLALLLALLPTLAHAQPADNPLLTDSIALRSIAMAAHTHLASEGTLPATLADTRPYLPDLGAYVSTLDTPPDAPDDPDDPAAWINANASFRYLPRAGIAGDDVPDWGTVVIAHLDLDKGHPTEPTPDNPEGRLFPVAFMDGHVESLSLADASRRIAESTQLFEGLATGGPVPARFELVLNLRAVSAALHAYADANDGLLPPTLGDLLPYVPDTNRASEPRDKARAFLSPARAGKTFIPERPTPAWVDRNTSLAYLGAGDVLLAWVEDPRRVILLRYVEPADIDGAELVTIATAGGRVTSVPEPYADAITDESRRVLRAARNATRLPDYQHVLRDLRLINAAITAYARDHDDHLPDTLGDLLEYVPDDPLTDAYAPLAPRDRALAFLSPADEAGIVPPDDPTPAWIDEKASYVWLGAGLTRRQLRDAGIFAILHHPLDQPIDIITSYGPDAVVPFLSPFDNVIPSSREATARTVAESTAAIAEASRDD